MAGNEHPAGWYPDPLHRADWRYWDGEAWNARVADRDQHTWVDEIFVAESKARAEAAGTPEPAIAPPPGPQPAPEVPTAVVTQAAAPPRAATPKPKVREHRVRHAIAAVSRRIAADLAVHWLAYIGVVLIFVGVFGFMVFSFRDVGRNLRPVAEVTIPLALAGAAWYLRRQRAPFVATLVAGLAGALVPIAMITSFNDDFGFPPDVSGAARPLITGGLCLVIAAAYAWWTTRRPETPLRFLAGPVAWLGIGVSVAVFADPIPLGTDVARADAWQSAAMLIAIALTLLVARAWPDSVLSRSTTAAAFPGLAIATAFGVTALVTDGGWYGAGTAGALALLVAFDLLEPRLRPIATGILEAVALGAAVLTLNPPVASAWQFAGFALAVLALTEWTARRRTPDWLLQTMTVSALVAMLGTAGEPWATVAASAIAAIWANARRYAPPRWLGRDPALMGVLAAGLPLGVAAGLFAAVSVGVALASLAAIVTVVAAGVRIDRDTEDPYWRVWIPSAAALVEFGVVLAALAPLDPMYTWLAGAAALLTVTAVAMPGAPVWRRWVIAASLIWTGWLTAMALELGGTVPAVRTLGLAVVTVLVALGARRVEDRYRTPLAGLAAAFGVSTLVSLGDWRAWDREAWVIGLAAYGATAAIGVVATTFVPRARRALSWPWAIAAVGTVGGAVVVVMDRPVRVGEGLPGFTAAAAAAVIALGAFVLVRRWDAPSLTEIGVGALAASAASLAVGIDATSAGIALGGLGVGLVATAVACALGRTPTPDTPRTFSLVQRAALEIATIGGLVAVSAAPATGDLGWIATATWTGVAAGTAAVGWRWRVAGLASVTAGSVAAAVIALGVWQEWSTADWLMVGSVAAAAVIVTATAVALLTRAARAWSLPWLVVGLGASATAIAVAFLDLDGATHDGPGYVVAGATLSCAIVGSLADRWAQPIWRWIAAVWIGLAGGVAAVAADLSTIGVARGAAIAAIGLTLLVVATWRLEHMEAWHRAGTALAAVALAASGPGTLILIDESTRWSQVASLVTLVLFACAIEAWTFGTLWRRVQLAESAPFLLVGAWCAFAAGSLSGNAQWYTVPIGVALIGVEEIRRADHRHAGLPPYSVSGRWIEYLGMMLIVAASMFQTLLVSPSYALLGVVLGMSIATWGALTHVRRRAVFGTASTALAIVLLLGEYLVDVVPMRAGMGLWISLALLGVVAVAGAAFLERGRHAWRAGVQRFGSVTHDWE
ncbi:MAG: hypothetical protein ACKOZL_09055 [Actinomycetes bacterium]